NLVAVGVILDAGRTNATNQLRTPTPRESKLTNTVATYRDGSCGASGSTDFGTDRTETNGRNGPPSCCPQVWCPGVVNVFLEALSGSPLVPPGKLSEVGSVQSVRVR